MGTDVRVGWWGPCFSIEIMVAARCSETVTARACHRLLSCPISTLDHLVRPTSVYHNGIHESQNVLLPSHRASNHDLEGHLRTTRPAHQQTYNQARLPSDGGCSLPSPPRLQSPRESASHAPNMPRISRLDVETLHAILPFVDISPGLACTAWHFGAKADRHLLQS